MHGLVCLDEQDRVLRPAILWNDQRTAAECAEIEERVGLERLIALTGNRALTGFTAPKLLWLRRHEPDVYARIRRIVLPKDYVRLRLTGEWAIDAADASGTLLFDVAHRRWSDEVLARSRSRASGSRPCASRRRSPAPATSRPRRSASASSSRARSPSCSARRASSSPRCPATRTTPQARVHAFCHAVPDTWEAMGVMLNAAGSLRWFRDAFAPDRRSTS